MHVFQFRNGPGWFPGPPDQQKIVGASRKPASPLSQQGRFEKEQVKSANMKAKKALQNLANWSPKPVQIKPKTSNMEVKTFQNLAQMEPRAKKSKNRKIRKLVRLFRFEPYSDEESSVGCGIRGKPHLSTGLPAYPAGHSASGAATSTWPAGQLEIRPASQISSQPAEYPASLPAMRVARCWPVQIRRPVSV